MLVLGRKSELKARPSHPPLTGRLLIGSLRSNFFAGFVVTRLLGDQPPPGSYFARIADFGRKALITGSLVST
jgi:hypothetical protein